MKKMLLTACLSVLAWGSANAATPFVNTGEAKQFITLGAHAMVGNSGIFQNFRSCYPEINELDVSAGTGFGIGMSARMAFSDFLALGVETNFMINNYRYNLAVAEDDAVSMTASFVRNHFYTLNFPAFITASFNLGSHVRWSVDMGLYYTYGLGGSSKSDLYRGRVNELGQFTTTVVHDKTPYYNSPSTFITSSYRGDVGLHMATAMVFSRRVSVGVRSQIGFKNEAHSFNVTQTPKVHNYNVMAVAEYLF